MGMQNIKQNVLLAPYTTLGVGGEAEYFVEIDTIEALRIAVQWAIKKDLKITILGGGSNVLISDGGVSGLVIKPTFRDVVVNEDGDEFLVTVSAGKNFDELVAELVDKDIWGLENLSLIPGSVGATPIQNVGAYGVEVGNFITSVVAYDPESDTFRIFRNDECGFAYRHSCFKEKENETLIIVLVTFRLSRKARPRLSYNDLTRYFKEDKNQSLYNIRSAIIEIRSRKFPDWSKVGTAGSFFKNPIVTDKEFTLLRKRHPGLPGFKLDNGAVKIPLGYILDKVLNLKGYKNGNVGLYREQALVLIAHDGATSEEVTRFANEIASRVEETTGIEIEWEVNVIHN